MYRTLKHHTSHEYCLTTVRVRKGLEVSSGSIDHDESVCRKHTLLWNHAVYGVKNAHNFIVFHFGYIFHNGFI